MEDVSPTLQKASSVLQFWRTEAACRVGETYLEKKKITSPVAKDTWVKQVNASDDILSI